MKQHLQFSDYTLNFAGGATGRGKRNVFQILIFLLLPVTLASAGTEWQQLLLKQSSTATVITVPAGKLLETTSQISQTTNPNFAFTLDYGNGNVLTRSDFALLGQPGNNILTSGSIPPGLFVGPVTLTLHQRGGSGFSVIQYRVLDNPSSPVALSSGMIVPPKTASPVSVALQESSDLINWMSISSFDYLPSNGSRFFRIHAAAK
jgi:hypothetical protein